MEIAKENREQDEQLVNATREKDLEIANFIREHELELAALAQTKDWDLRTAMRTAHGNKTFITLRSIDSDRRSYLCIFLYENGLLSTFGKRDILSGADLRNIIIESPVTGAYEFHSLAIQLVNLWNITFTWCVFKGVTNFNGSILNDMKFDRVTFEYQLFIHGAKLTSVILTESISETLQWTTPDLFAQRLQMLL
ncbi:unnamed protein product [Adineta ricciae]|uniref:Uncharacterized protein n=1 Tax=Adineta ricciae TaxID=249248 RepID=A0A814MAD6_ADIRI|nr:unnamed protein product [Adineta ricciae]CAF1076884.1 unnamed protein product [Adineta ricciae]